MADDQVLSELRAIRAQTDGIPLIHRNITVLQQEVRAVRAAVNDFARINPTIGEIEALHADVNRVQAENSDLQHRVTTLGGRP